MTAAPELSPPRAARRSARRSPWLNATPPSFAVEVASRRVTVVELARSGTPVVAACASEALPVDAVTPALTGTNIANPRSVADAIRRACERAGTAVARRVALVIPDTVARVSLLHFEQVPAKPAELDQLIKWQLRKATPFPLEEATVQHIPASTQDGGTTFAAVVIRQDVLAQYEAVTDLLGMHAGIVDLASFNVMNAVMSSGAATAGDWLLVCLAHEATTIAILRGSQLLFYRHRAAIEEEPLSALVHQTAMYHEDRLGGSTFSKVLLCGAALAERGADRARADISARLGVAAQTVDVRGVAELSGRMTATPDLLDALAAPVGVLVREHPSSRAARFGETSPEPKAKAGAA